MNQQGTNCLCHLYLLQDPFWNFATEQMTTIEVDEDNMEQVAVEAATLYLTNLLAD